MNQATRMATLAVSVLTGATLAACGSSPSEAQGQDGSGGCKGATVKVAQAAPTFDYYPFYVAMGSGFLKDEGIKAEVTDLSNGSNIVSAIVTGDVDLGFTTMPATVKAASEGAPVAAFAWLTGMTTNIVVHTAFMEEKGVTRESPDQQKLAALKGTTLAVTGLGSGSDLVLRYMLKQAGINPDKDVKIIPTGSGAASLSGFTSNRFDGFATSSPATETGIAKGKGSYLFHSSNGDYKPLQDFPYLVALSSTRTIKAKSGLMTCFTTALAKAQKQIHEDPAAAAKGAQTYMTGIDPKLYEKYYPAEAPSMPASPVITDAAIERASEFMQVASGAQISKEVLGKVVDQSIAAAAVKGLDSN
jgi:NitT/TauT family transport system substrate-binding protein